MPSNGRNGAKGEYDESCINYTSFGEAPSQYCLAIFRPIGAGQRREVTGTLPNVFGGPLRKVLYILGQLSDSDVDWLAGAGKRVKEAKGTKIINFGVSLSQVFIVLDGELSVQTNKGIELAKVSSGEILGEMSLVDSRPPSASVVVLQDAVVLALDKTVLQAKLDLDTGFSSRFYRAIAIFLSERMRSTVGRMGYGDPGNETPTDTDELDENVLDNVHLAGARFERLLKKLMG